MMVKIKPIVNPVNMEDELKDIIAKGTEKPSTELTGEEKKNYDEKYDEFINPKDKDEAPTIREALAAAWDKLMTTRDQRSAKKLAENLEKTAGENNIPLNSENLPPGMLYKLNFLRQRKETGHKVAAAGAATMLTLTAAWHLWPEPQEVTAAEPVVKTTYLHNISGDVQIVEPDLHTPVHFNTSAEKLLSMPDLDESNRILINWTYHHGGGTDQSVTAVDVDSWGNVEIPFKAAEANVSGTIKMDYQTALKNLQYLLDGGYDQIEINTEAYHKAGTESVYRNIDGNELVNKTMHALNITGRDPAKYTMNITSQIDAVNKTAKHIVKFEAKDGSDSFDSGVLSVEKMAEVLDINNDNIGGDDYKGFVNQLQLWEGINYGVAEKLQPTIDSYESMLTELYIRLNNTEVQRDQNNSALNNLSAHFTNVLNIVEELGYIGNVSDYDSVEDAVADIVDKAKDLLEVEFSIKDKRLIRYMYENVPEQYKPFIAPSEEKLNEMLDGDSANGEAGYLNISIAPKLTELQNGTVVDITGATFLDSEGTANDYTKDGLTRDGIKELLYWAGVGEGRFLTEPSVLELDKTTTKFVYDELMKKDKSNAENGTATSYHTQFICDSKVPAWFNDDLADGELANETAAVIKGYLGVDGIPGEVNLYSVDSTGPMDAAVSAPSSACMREIYKILNGGE